MCLLGIYFTVDNRPFSIPIGQDIINVIIVIEVTKGASK